MSATAALPHRVVAVRQLLGSAVAWWLAELRDMVPQGWLDGLIGARRHGTVLAVGRDQVSLLIERQAHAATSISLAEDDAGALSARVQAAIRGVGASRTVAIRLEPDAVFECSLELPLAAERSLPQIVRNQLGKVTPLPVHTVRFAYRVTERLPAAKLLKLRVVIAKQATIERALALADGIGLRPSRITTGPASGAPFLLWQAGVSHAGKRPRQRWLRALEMCGVVLFVAAYGLHVYRLDHTRADLRTAVAAARQMAAGTERVATQVRHMRAALDALSAQKDAPSPLRIIDALTRLVPQDSWVYQLSVHGRTVEMAGYSPRATDMISRIEGSALFEQPKFRSPITAVPDGKSEQFSLSFQVREATAP